MTSHWHESGPKECWAQDVLELVRDNSKDQNISMPNLMRLTKDELKDLTAALENGPNHST